MNRQQLRELEKQVLLLRAEQYRLDLRAQCRQLAGSSPGELAPGNTLAPWLQSAPDLLTLFLPARWQRRLRGGLLAWKVGRVLFRKADHNKAPDAA